MNKTNKIKTTETLIDLFLHNGDLVDDTKVVECPFSDHCFILCNLTIKISSLLDEDNFREMKNFKSIEDKWNYFKDTLLKIIDNVAPTTTVIAQLFNYSIIFVEIPNDWKTAIVTPLYKNKGSTEDINNYRGISVLPPLAKLFEKLLHKQIIAYLNNNKILSNDQHGFIANHSCESALHEIITEINTIKSKRLIGLLLFKDFKKAFDTVDQKLFILKLRKYGFSDSAISLLLNYFLNRTQYVKIDDVLSDAKHIELGVPQGSVLGPLLFLIYINDLVEFLSNFKVKLFADDTTLIKSGNNLSDLIDDFRNSIKQLITWCKFNRIDINWSKTKLMFISNKKNTNLNKIEYPTHIEIDSNLIR
ncbi:unnamed protein product [Brachionus calyciflorus]|uniref:Reverse transcriptase domain-containing protein n=1 Tax=Brachionus calyciflorus TaxID=104777 RepID=A0A814IKI0_9BILA|nr:unnamed protein product [Brachionus calyciflorus]